MMNDIQNSEAPRPLHADAVRILPLGGLGEIGLNMMVVEAKEGLLIIDCGLMFPESYMLGIDLVIPDISAIAARQHEIAGILLTHGHEDHIGAIPFLIEALGCPPIYGSPLTLGLLATGLTTTFGTAMSSLVQAVRRAEFPTMKSRRRIPRSITVRGRWAPVRSVTRSGAGSWRSRAADGG